MAGNPRAGKKNATGIFEIVDYDRRIIEGTLTTERLDRDNEIVDHHSVKSAFPTFLETGPALVVLHDLLAPAGRVLKHWSGVKNGRKAVKVRVQVAKSRNPDTPCEFAWEMVEQGVLNGFSFQYEYSKKVNEKTSKGMAKRVFVEDIWEVSLVPVMANPDGTFDQVIKSMKSLIGNRPQRKRLVATAIKSLTKGENMPLDKETKEELNEVIKTAIEGVGEKFSQEIKSLGETLSQTLTSSKTPTPPAEPNKGEPIDPEKVVKEFLTGDTGKKMLAGLVENSETLATYKKALQGLPGGDGDEDDDSGQDIKMVTPIGSEGNDAWNKFKKDAYRVD